MKDEYIRKDEAITAFQMAAKSYKITHHADDCVVVDWCENIILVREAMEVLRNLPTYSVPVEHGKWIHYKDEHTCSLCYGVVTGDWDDEDYYEYCPFCGARMNDHDYQGW